MPPYPCGLLRLPGILFPLPVEVDLFLAPGAVQHSADTGNPVGSPLSHRHVDPVIGFQGFRPQVQSFYSLRAHLKIPVRAARVIYVRNGNISLLRCVELKDTGQAAHDLRTEIQRPRLTEQTAAAGIQIMAVLAQHTGHAALVKEQVNGRVIPIAVQLPQYADIALHGNGHAADGKPRRPADLLKTVQLFFAGAARADLHAGAFIAENNGIIRCLIPEAVRHLPGRHIRQLPSSAVGKLQHPGRTQIDGKHEMYRLRLPLRGKPPKRLLPSLKGIPLPLQPDPFYPGNAGIFSLPASRRQYTILLKNDDCPTHSLPPFPFPCLYAAPSIAP